MTRISEDPVVEATQSLKACGFALRGFRELHGRHLSAQNCLHIGEPLCSPRGILKYVQGRSRELLVEVDELLGQCLLTF
jgi:hypothetical protein